MLTTPKKFLVATAIASTPFLLLQGPAHAETLEHKYTANDVQKMKQMEDDARDGCDILKKVPGIGGWGEVASIACNADVQRSLGDHIDEAAEKNCGLILKSTPNPSSSGSWDRAKNEWEIDC